MALTEPTAEDALKLFQDIEQLFPSATLGEDKWQILAVSALLPTPSTNIQHIHPQAQISAVAGGGHPAFAAELYKYLISQPQYSTPDQRKALIRRLREALVKLVSVVGVPKALEAIFSIADIEREEDKDYSSSR